MTTQQPMTVRTAVVSALRIGLAAAALAAAQHGTAAADSAGSPVPTAIENPTIVSRIQDFLSPAGILRAEPNAINPAARFRASWTRLQSFHSQESGGDEIYLLYALLRKGAGQVIPSLTVNATGYLSGLNTGDIRNLATTLMADQPLSGPMAISYLVVEADDSGTGNIASSARTKAQAAFNQALTQGIGDPCGLASRVGPAMASAVDGYDKWFQDDDERIGGAFRWCFSQANLESMGPGGVFNGSSRHTGNSGDYRVDLQLRRTQ